MKTDRTKQTGKKTQALIEGALMVALGYVLSVIPFFSMPTGGSVTLLSTLPIVMFSLRRGGRWGVAAASLYAFIQALQGVSNILFCQTLGAMLLCFLLDYYLAYAFLGFAGPLARLPKNRWLGLLAGVLVTGFARFACSFLSGIVLWGSYAPEGAPVWHYSAVYNASWCGPDVALVLAAVLLMYKVQPGLFMPAPAGNGRPASA